MPHNTFHYRCIKLILAIISLVIFSSSIIFIRLYKHKKVGVTARILIEKAYKQAHQEKPQASPEIVLRNTNLYLFGSNKYKNCLIQAEESKMFTNHNEIECTNVTCKITTKKNIVATLKAGKSYINQNTKSMFLPGVVNGQFKKWSLQEHDLFYNAKKHLVLAGKTCLQSKNGISFQAKKSSINLKKEIFKFYDGVTSSFEK